MEKQTIESIVEALLFASGEALPLEKMAEIVEIGQDELQSVLTDMMDRYNFEKRGIKIIRLGNKYQMATRGEYSGYIQKIVEPRKKNPLSKATLEVLAIVAYKQPVTRSDIEHVRGVNSDNSVSRLLELGLIEETGRLDAPGRPALFSTTDEFLRNFALSGLEELTPLEDYVIEETEVMHNIEEQEKY